MCVFAAVCVRRWPPHMMREILCNQLQTHVSTF